MAEDIRKKDWKLFRERIADWQESYMAKLNEEYIAILSKDGLASEKFWELDDRIKRDKRKPGVSLTLEKNDMESDTARLIKDGAITWDDLEGFSDDFIDLVNRIMGV